MLARLTNVHNNFFPDFPTAYLICDWVIRIAMLLVVPLRRPPEATRSLLLLVFFLPVVGLLLYLAIGRTRFPAWRRARFASLSPFLSDVSAKFAATSIVPTDPRYSALALAQNSADGPRWTAMPSHSWMITMMSSLG